MLSFISSSLALAPFRTWRQRLQEGWELGSGVAGSYSKRAALVQACNEASLLRSLRLIRRDRQHRL